MKVIKEFRDFAMKGNVVDMAVGVIIGAAFGKIVGTLVDKVMMPPIGWISGGIDFSDKCIVLSPEVKAGLDAAGTIVAAKPAVVIGYGEFINVVINFVIVAFCLFMVIKAMNAAKRKDAIAPPPAPPPPTTQEKLLMEIRDALRARG